MKPGNAEDPGPDALVRAPKEFSNLIESIPLGVFRLSPAPGHPVVFANRNLALMLGYGSADEIIGTHARTFFPPSEDISSIRHDLFIRDALTNIEVPLVRNDGSEIRVMITAKLQYAADHSLEQIEGFCEDITERKVFEMEMQYHDAELNRYALALSLANKKLNLLQSITRHDILNQLMALGFYLELMKESITNPEFLEYISTGEKVTETIRNQIQFTRDYQDIGVSSAQWFDVEKTVRDATASLPLGKVVLETDVCNLMVYADPLFEKVFYNLVENALRHAQGMTRIRFSYYLSGDSAVLICEDDGCGVPSGQKEAIFRREFYKHTGFGLFLSREILGITGLSIRETGDPGTGARFEIIIPRDFFRIGL
ncbi:ATP-binding protein [Methanoregula sp.]|jgi:PAS domain S-box-containing protein|uniref:PAS domain-containing sensor histidine kinase n=1 Tax=Methanoregula sp. TaxID=2052170 RepID=UPI003C1C7126